MASTKRLRQARKNSIVNLNLYVKIIKGFYKNSSKSNLITYELRLDRHYSEFKQNIEKSDCIPEDEEAKTTLYI